MIFCLTARLSSRNLEHSIPNNIMKKEESERHTAMHSIARSALTVAVAGKFSIFKQSYQQNMSCKNDVSCGYSRWLSYHEI